MTALVAFVFLAGTLLFAKGYVGRKPIAVESPLDVDKGIPFPEAGQASSIFSLTALFGPYLAMFILLGFAPLFGLALGTATAFFYLKREIGSSNAVSFQAFVASRFNASKNTWKIVIAYISITQLFFAASELLIMHSIVVQVLNFQVRLSSLITASLAVVGYLYCLRGGYLSVFLTDIIQFIFIVVMCMMLTGYALHEFIWGKSDIVFGGAMPGLWFRHASDSYLMSFFTIIISSIMGFSFIICSPDTWKRVYIVTKCKKGSIAMLFASSFFPFVVILPLAVSFSDGSMFDIAWMRFVIAPFMNKGALQSTIVLLGLMSCFLSSFDSSLISSVHMLSILKKQRVGRDTITDFYKNMSGVFFVLCILAYCLPLIIRNPYFTGNALIINYAVLAGYLLGSKWGRRKINPSILLMHISICSTGWIIYLLSKDMIDLPNLEQIGTIPIGTGIMVSSTVLFYIIGRCREPY